MLILIFSFISAVFTVDNKIVETTVRDVDHSFLLRLKYTHIFYFLADFIWIVERTYCSAIGRESSLNTTWF